MQRRVQGIAFNRFATALAFTEIAGLDAVQGVFDLEQQDVIQVVSTAGHQLFVIALGEIAFIRQTSFFIPNRCCAGVERKRAVRSYF